jgi:hypothetical protein
MTNERHRNVLINLLILSCLLFSFNPIAGQSIGGNAVFNFVTLSPSAKTTALGGLNISHLNADLGMAIHQPAFLNKEMNGQLHLSVKPYLASISQYNFNGAHFINKANTTIGWGVQYMDYGTIPMTDIAGNELGNFRPNEYALHLSAATSYQKNFKIGTSLKFLQSKYGIYHSNGIAADLGIVYAPYNGLTQWAILVNNVGVQLTKFNKKENLPFNITAGVSKKLANAPFQFSLTAQRLTVRDNTYNDPLYNALEGFKSPSKYQNVFNHLIVASEINLGPSVNIDLGYNFLRRFDLNIQNQKNSLNGFSAGCTFLVNNLQMQYANAFFQNNLNHHFTIIYQLKKRY